MPSPEFQHLSDRLFALKKRFIDFDIPPDRDPTHEELDSIACFKLLLHAEVENYIEERIRSAIFRANEAWSQGGKISRCFFTLLLRWSQEISTATEKCRDTPRMPDITSILEKLSKKAIEIIDSNNSIKQAKFTQLAALAGMMADDHSPALLAALESFGKTRGDVAHRSVGRTRILNDPRVEGKDAEQLISMLGDFDTALDALSV